MIKITSILRFVAEKQGVSYSYTYLLWHGKVPASSPAARAVMAHLRKCLKAKEVFEKTIGLR
jgi:hypothetical protein